MYIIFSLIRVTFALRFLMLYAEIIGRGLGTCGHVDIPAVVEVGDPTV